jgi:hypothetical protein
MFNSDSIVQICVTHSPICLCLILTLLYRSLLLIHLFVYVPGHKDVVKLLILTRADINLKMGDLTAVDIARDFGRSDLLELFQS